MQITSAGNVTILNATATDSKSIGITNAGGTTGWTFGNGITAAAHQFVIYDNTAGLERLRITSGGDVEISNGGSFSIGSATQEAKTQTQVTSAVDSSGKIILTTISDGMSSATMSKVTIYGADNTTSSFYDEIVVAANSTTIDVLTTINRGAAPARTYSVVSNQLKLVMASLSFNVNVKSEAMGYPF